MTDNVQREPVKHESKYWIEAERAPEAYGRNERTIRRWVAEGRVRRIRPMDQVWLYRPDLAECEAAKPRRKGS